MKIIIQNNKQIIRGKIMITWMKNEKYFKIRWHKNLLYS